VFWLVLVGLALALLGPALLRTLRYTGPHGETLMCDFFQDWASARNAWQGRAVYAEHQETMPLYLDAAWDNDSLFLPRNSHPPVSVLLVLPLAGLDLPDALLAWNLMSLLCLGGTIWLLVRQFPSVLTPWSLLPVALLLLLSAPLRQHFQMGQFTLPLLLLLTGMWAADRSDKTVWAGALLGAATAVKLFPGFFFLYFVLRGRWSVVGWGLLSILGLNGMAVLVLGPGTYLDYVQEVFPHLEKARDYWGNTSLIGLWCKLFNPRNGRVEPLWSSPAFAWTMIYLGHAVVLAVLAWCIRRARTIEEHDLTFSLSMAAMLLVSPISWDHYLLLFLTPLVIWWVRLPSAEALRPAFLVLLLAWTLDPTWLWRVLMPGIQELPGGGAGPLHTLTALSFSCYLNLACFVLGVILCRAACQARHSAGMLGVPSAARMLGSDATQSVPACVPIQSVGTRR
jgi:hypothetical protein